MSGSRNDPPISINSPARNGSFFAIRQAVEHQQDSRGIVVDHRGRFRPREIAQKLFNVRVAISTLAGGDVEFEVRGLPCGERDGLDRFFRQCGASEIGMEHGAGQIEDAAQRGRAIPM